MATMIVMSQFMMRCNVVWCLKFNIMAMAFIGLFYLLLTVSADSNFLNKNLPKESKLQGVGAKTRYKYPTTSAPRIKLSETPECADDIRRICPSSILNNNFAVLDCLQNDKVIVFYILLILIYCCNNCVCLFKHNISYVRHVVRCHHHLLKLHLF